MRVREGGSPSPLPLHSAIPPFEHPTDTGHSPFILRHLTISPFRDINNEQGSGGGGADGSEAQQLVHVVPPPNHSFITTR